MLRQSKIKWTPQEDMQIKHYCKMLGVSRTDFNRESSSFYIYFLWMRTLEKIQQKAINENINFDYMRDVKEDVNKSLFELQDPILRRIEDHVQELFARWISMETVLVMGRPVYNDEQELLERARIRGLGKIHLRVLQPDNTEHIHFLKKSLYKEFLVKYIPELHTELSYFHKKRHTGPVKQPRIRGHPNYKDGTDSPRTLPD